MTGDPAMPPPTAPSNADGVAAHFGSLNRPAEGRYRRSIVQHSATRGIATPDGIFGIERTMGTVWGELHWGHTEARSGTDFGLVPSLDGQSTQSHIVTTTFFLAKAHDGSRPLSLALDQADTNGSAKS